MTPDSGSRLAGTSRDAIRRSLRAGLTPDAIYARNRRKRAVFLAAIEEEAKVEGTFRSISPTPTNVARLRDGSQLRWERIAVRIFGNPSWTIAARALYDQARGPGASRRSYTGRGRRFPDMAL